MAPIRRYLRITKYSVLECRIYLDNPALAHSWLLNPRDPVLPRVIEAVRPLVLPKLREERERSRKKSTRKRGIKDVVNEDNFEVSIFLTETSTRHSLLYKHKHFRDKTQTKLTSNSSKLTGASCEAPIDVDNRIKELAADANVPVLLEENSDGENDAFALREIPTMDGDETAVGSRTRRTKRRRGSGSIPLYVDDDVDDGSYGRVSEASDIQNSDENDDLYGASSAEEMGPPPAKRRKDVSTATEHEESDDKKKLAMDISYEGFSIYGRVLCLVVKRRESGGGVGGGGRTTSATAARGKAKSTAPGGGQAVMENWITSTQIPADELAAP